MNLRKLLLVIIVLSLITIATGCETKTLSAAQVNPIKKGEIVSVQIIKGKSYQQKFTDTSVIAEIIANLNNVKVRKASVADEKKVLDSGNAFAEDSTIIMNLMSHKRQDAQSTAILLSEKELCMPDIKSSIEKTRTVSYISDIDVTTLKSIKALYSLAEKITK